MASFMRAFAKNLFKLFKAEPARATINIYKQNKKTVEKA